jgi:hypothetical protein
VMQPNAQVGGAGHRTVQDAPYITPTTVRRSVRSRGELRGREPAAIDEVKHCSQMEEPGSAGARTTSRREFFRRWKTTRSI